MLLSAPLLLGAPGGNQDALCVVSPVRVSECVLGIAHAVLRWGQRQQIHRTERRKGTLCYAPTLRTDWRSKYTPTLGLMAIASAIGRLERGIRRSAVRCDECLFGCMNVCARYCKANTSCSGGGDQRCRAEANAFIGYAIITRIGPRINFMNIRTMNIINTR